MPENEEAETADIEAENEENASDESDVEVETAEKQEEDPLANLRKALKAERDARRTAEKERNTFRQQLADKDKPADEQAIETARREADEAATERANARIVRSELKAAAAGKVKRPDLLIKVTDLSAIPVDENGDPDPDALNDAITTFLEDYPELAADAAKFSGSADQGSKGKQSKPGQLTREDLAKLTPDEINKARAEGRLKALGY